jgi:hypothetical protein
VCLSGVDQIHLRGGQLAGRVTRNLWAVFEQVLVESARASSTEPAVGHVAQVRPLAAVRAKVHLERRRPNCVVPAAGTVALERLVRAVRALVSPED